jgi:putative transposase
VTRVLDRLAITRGLPQVLRTDNGLGVLRARDADLGAHARGDAAPDRTGQADPERIHRIVQWPLRDECLNEHWFTSLAHAQAVIETGRRAYNDERPKKGLGGLTPAAYALQLTTRVKTAKVTAGL